MTAFIAALGTLTIIFGDINYSREIIKGTSVPTKSSWIIFLLVSVLNLASFLATKVDLISGMPIISDTIFYVVILAILFFHSPVKTSLKKFELYYLMGAIICMIFWLVSNNSFIANILTQIILALAYIPTMHNILKAKKSEESLVSWIAWTCGSFIAGYPALANQNILAMIHCFRAVIMCVLVLALIIKYTKK